MLGRSWVEINLSNIENNYLEYKKYLHSGQIVIAVVKANAYGHGDVEIAKRLQKLGVYFFAVSNLNEGIRLRKNGIKGNILVLGYTPKYAINQLIEYDISQTVYSVDYLKNIEEYGNLIKIHLAIDTGMNRIGFRLEQLEKGLLARFNKLNVEGIFTHLSCADMQSERYFTNLQIEKFKRAIDKFERPIKFIHYANSCGGVNYNFPFANAVRLGILLYGLKPYEDFINKNFKPALKWKSVVSMVKEIEKGEFVGYGKGFVAKRKMKIATISTGYADGFDRRLSGLGFISINGKIAKVIGMVCMDQFMVDATNCIDVKLGDEVEIIGDRFSADNIAKNLKTINYEVVCKISERVKRIFIN